MPTALSCDCGARFEADAPAAGAGVPCPECGTTCWITAPATPRTSLFALFSLVLALMGAATFIGSLLAVSGGLVALIRIGRRPDRLGGRAFATTAVVLGLIGGALSGWVVVNREHVLQVSWLRQRVVAALADPDAAWPAATRDGGCLLPRPSPDWLRLRNDRGGDPAIDDLQTGRDVLLAHRGRRAYLDLASAGSSVPVSAAAYQTALLETLQTPRPALLGDEDDAPPRHAEAQAAIRLLGDRALPRVDRLTGHEWAVELYRGGRTWRLLVRAYRRERGPRADLYVARACAPAPVFVALESELRQALDGIRFPP